MDAVLFIVADETFAAGQRDQAMAVAAAVWRQGRRAGVRYLFYKTAGEGAGSPEVFPLDEATYAAVPPVADMLPAGRLVIVGVGHSTLARVLEVAGRSPGAGTAWITHIPETAAELRLAADAGVKLFAATTREALVRMDAEAGARIAFTRLDAVPNSTSLAACMEEYEKYTATPEGAAVAAMAGSGQPFAVAIINAGFVTGEPRRYIPYTEEEARLHGAALGGFFDTETALFALHGGPRNLRDSGTRRKPEDTHQPQDALAAFVEAYSEKQYSNGLNSNIFTGPCDGLANKVRAAFILGRMNNCQMFISNDESYVTKSAAFTLIDRKKKTLASFPFAAQLADRTGQRQAEVEEWHRRGVAKLLVENGKLHVSRHPDEESGAVPQGDPADLIVTELGLTTA